MQYEVFTALHDALEQEIQQAADKSRTLPARGPDRTVAAHLATSSARSETQ